MQWAQLEGSKNALIEQAKEELELLEYQHPNKFDCLKLELKAFISELESQQKSSSISSMSPCLSAATQESSSRKKRKKSGVVEEVDIVGDSSSHVIGSSKRRCKTDAVLERAQECLHKIQHFKTSFCS